MLLIINQAINSLKFIQNLSSQSAWMNLITFESEFRVRKFILVTIVFMHIINVICMENESKFFWQSDNESNHKVNTQGH